MMFGYIYDGVQVADVSFSGRMDKTIMAMYAK